SRIKSGPNTYLYREESRRLYVWPQDSAQEYLVYDFNLALGDTFQVQWGNINPGISHTLTVTQIDTIVTLPDNAVRKIMWLGNDEGALGNWIEGIGSPICDFLYPVYFLSVSGYCSLECFSIESVVLYPESGPGMTCPLNSGLANPANDLQFSVQPNPVMAERFDIQCPIKHPCKASFTLHNTFGQLITHSPSQLFSGEEIRFTVEAADLVNGLYFLRFNTESGTATKTIVIQR
ncbi:MAG: T9SS type A sorting domain-containing protein, partial [Saprospiraceae bacterium]|nr:T9SS type A sorting domain-containing protein [Saprospiraceae bacterium]